MEVGLLLDLVHPELRLAELIQKRTVFFIDLVSLLLALLPLSCPVVNLTLEVAYP